MSMTDIEKARQLFQKAGFDLPAIPEKLAVHLKQRSELDFSTRPIPKSPNFLNFYVDEANKTQVSDYALLSRAVNSPTRSAIHYFFVFGPLRMFLQLFWGGGAYIKNADLVAQIAQIRECFALADQIVSASIISVCKGSDRLTIVCTNDGDSYWVAPGQCLQEEKWYLKRPEEVLGEALQWLRNKRKCMTFMDDARMLAEDMDEKEREEFLAIAEEIDREEDEASKSKVIFISDYLKRQTKKKVR